MMPSTQPINPLQRLQEYLDTFSAKDLQGIRNHLHPDVEVFMGDTLVATGRDTILPSYQKDFDKGKVVTVGVPAKIIDGEELGLTVEVGLVSVVEGEGTQTSLTVKYFYNHQGVQIKHVITDVVTSALPNTTHQ